MKRITEQDSHRTPSEGRIGLDITERLWQLCKYAVNAEDVAQALAMIVEKFENGQLKPMVRIAVSVTFTLQIYVQSFILKSNHTTIAIIGFKRQQYQLRQLDSGLYQYFKATYCNKLCGAAQYYNFTIRSLAHTSKGMYDRCRLYEAAKRLHTPLE